MTLAAVDIETYEYDQGKLKPVLDSTRFYLGCYKEEGEETRTFYDAKALWEHILERGKKADQKKQTLYVYGHNHAYDFYGYANIKDPNITYYAERPFIAGYKTEKREAIKFLDTQAIFKMALKGVAEYIGTKKLEMPEGTENMKLEDFQKLLETYCKRDTEITLKAVQKIKEKLEEEGVNIKRLYTINQIAISNMLYKLRQMNDEKVKHIFFWKDRGIARRTLRSEEIHAAYRGGRVQAWQTGLIREVRQEDCNSLYPYASTLMRFPDLASERKVWKPLRKMSEKELLGKIGISRCMVKNNKDKLGSLMIRTNTQRYTPGKGKLMLGTWTHKELKEAIKQGYEIIDIEWSVTWEEGENILKEIIPEIYEKKQKSTGFDRYFHKMMMNAAFGKMAQYKVNQHIIIDSVEKTEEYIKKNYEAIRGLDMEYVFRKRPEETSMEERKPYYMPIIPTLINAWARCYMNEQYRKYNIKKLAYTDTDSIMHTGQTKVKIGEKMGEFKIDEEGDAYIYGLKTKLIGSKITIAGFNQKNMTKEEFLAGKVKSNRMVTIKTMKDGLRPGQFTIEERDLKEQKEQHEESQEKLADIKMYIDWDIEDYSYFAEQIRWHSENESRSQ